MRFLALDRPLAVFDIESTGLNPRTDRILELAVVRLEPGGGRTERRWLLDPGVPIPAESTAVHGITDETVRGAPRFEEKAAEILAFFRDCATPTFRPTPTPSTARSTRATRSTSTARAASAG